MVRSGTGLVLRPARFRAASSGIFKHCPAKGATRFVTISPYHSSKLWKIFLQLYYYYYLYIHTRTHEKKMYHRLILSFLKIIFVIYKRIQKYTIINNTERLKTNKIWFHYGQKLLVIMDTKKWKDNQQFTTPEILSLKTLERAAVISLLIDFNFIESDEYNTNESDLTLRLYRNVFPTSYCDW